MNLGNEEKKLQFFWNLILHFHFSAEPFLVIEHRLYLKKKIGSRNTLHYRDDTGGGAKGGGSVDDTKQKKEINYMHMATQILR